MQKITPFLWFDGKAEEAANHYVSIFKNARIIEHLALRRGLGRAQGQRNERNLRARWPAVHRLEWASDVPVHAGHLLLRQLQTQQEVDELWEKLSAGGEKQRCGWLKDKYGVSWQIIPTVLGELLQHKDGAKSKRAMQAMMQMDKIDIAALKQAAAG